MRGLQKLPPEITTVEEFIKKFFKSYNNQFGTEYVHSKKGQSRRGARRSVGDMTKITQYYFPKATLTEVRDIMNRMVSKGQLSVFICNSVHKRVFWHAHFGQSATDGNGLSHDEFGWTRRMVIK